MTMVRIDVAQGLAFAGQTRIPIQADTPDLLHLEGGTCLHAIRFEAREKVLCSVSRAADPVADLVTQVNRLATLHQGEDDPHLVAVMALALAGADQDFSSPPPPLPVLATQFGLSEEILVAMPAYRVDQLARQWEASPESPWNQIVFPDEQLSSMEALASHLAENLLRCKGPVSENSPALPQSPETSHAPVSLSVSPPKPPVQVDMPRTESLPGKRFSEPVLTHPDIPPSKPSGIQPAATFSGIRAKALWQSEPSVTTASGIPKATSSSRAILASEPSVTTASGMPEATSSSRAVLTDVRPEINRAVHTNQGFAAVADSQHMEQLAAWPLDQCQQGSTTAIPLPPPSSFRGDPKPVPYDVTPASTKLHSGSSPSFHKEIQPNQVSSATTAHPFSERSLGENTIGFKPQRSQGFRAPLSLPLGSESLSSSQSAHTDNLAEQLADLLSLEADLRGYLP